jgi:hypothetical protein
MPFCESRLGDFWPAQVATDAVAADIILWDTRTLADVPLSHGAEGTSVRSLDLEIHRGGLAAVLFDLILDLLPLVERAQSSALDSRDMDKHILATALRSATGLKL